VVANIHRPLAREAERDRWQAKQEQRQRDEDRARLARLEAQWSAYRQAQARAAQQQAHELFWRDRLKACDELIAMCSPQPAAQPVAQPVQWAEPYQGSTQIGCSDFNPALLTDPSQW
jgi:hypothetical protein